MSQFLPKGEFKWLDVEQQSPTFYNVADNNPIGYILEVDLEYPEKIHDDHADLPMCPEHMQPPGSKQKKLLTTLFDKEHYVIHYRALKQVLQQGLVLKKIHRAIEFKQEDWLQKYVNLNTEKRTNAKNAFEKMFYKLIVISVYGKTMENERKRVIVKMVHKWKGRYSAEALIAKPNFHSRSIFSDNLAAVQLNRTEITITKPIYVGMSVLDISKTHMYDFHYNFMKKHLGKSCKLLYTDTDSLIYDIQGTNIYDLMRQNLDKFDTSDYPEDNTQLLPRVNPKKVGLFKDECNSAILEEFLGLKSKLYCLKIFGEKEVQKKAKGVKTHVVKNKITYDDYKNCLLNKTIKKVEQNTFKSRLHVVHTEKQEKVGLSPHDDKRHLMPDTTDTLPHGHWSIISEELIHEYDTEMEVEIIQKDRKRDANCSHSPNLDEEEPPRRKKKK